MMRIVDRESAKVVAGFRSTRRANARLLQLTRAKLLKRFFVGSVANGRKSVYTLSSNGAQLVDSSLGGISRPAGRLVVGDTFVAHQMAINQIYLGVKYGKMPGAGRLIRWTAPQTSISESIKIRPDSYFEIRVSDGVKPMFLEADLGTEALKVWEQKVRYYVQLALSGDFQRLFKFPQFRVLVTANSERRLLNIRSTVAKTTDKIFWFSTFEQLTRDGFWSPAWLRPIGNQRHSLL